MKYIEKLIAEIKRLIKVNKELKSSRFTEGVAAGYGDVLSAITSLQQEQPEADLEKAAQRVYEAWMGGTMDDVRRDMVELGKVLNARK